MSLENKLREAMRASAENHIGQLSRSDFQHVSYNLGKALKILGTPHIGKKPPLYLKALDYLFEIICDESDRRHKENSKALKK